MKTNKTTRLSRFIGGWFLPLLALLTVSSLRAEGIKEVAPDSASAPVMLEAAGDFASFNGPEAGRLLVEMTGPSETLFIGLAPEYSRRGQPWGNNFSRYRFRIVRLNDDGTQEIVHGPYTINNENANVNSYREAEFGNYSTDLTDSQNRRIFEFQPNAGGTFSIEFAEIPNDGNSNVNIPFWDFSVVSNGVEQEGRLYSKSWGFRLPQVTGDTDECEFDREFSGSFFSYTDDGFVSKIDFAGSEFQGLSFSVAFNTTGPSVTGDLAFDRQSVEGFDSTRTTAQHLIFLTEPNETLFPSDVQNCGQIVNVGNSFACTDEGGYCLEVEVTKPGQVEVVLDFNNNNILDSSSTDVAIVAEFGNDMLSMCIPWDGLRGDGTRADYTDTVNVIITYAQGVQHYSAYDVEYLFNGFTVETVRPNCGQVGVPVKLFWDDRDIILDPGIDGVPKDNRNGSFRDEIPRAWSNFSLGDQAPGTTCLNFRDELTVGYGDKSTLNTWWYASSEISTPVRFPVVSAAIVGPQIICQGDTAELLATDPFADRPLSFAWSGPGVVDAVDSTLEVSVSGQYCVVVTDANGCSEETCADIVVLEFDGDQFPANLDICFGEEIQLPEAGDPAFSYLWSPNVGIDDITSNQPTFSPEATTTYEVIITATNSVGQSCEVRETVIVNVSEEIGLQVTGGGPICDATTTLNATTMSDATVVLNDANGNEIETGSEFIVPVSGETDYILVATNALGCTDTVVFSVSGGPVDIQLPDTLLNCTSEGINIQVDNLDANDTLTYVWAPAELFDPATINGPNPTFIGEPGDYLATVTATNQYNCSTTEEVRIILINDDGELDFTPAIDCDGTTVSFTNNSTVAFGYLYDFGDGSISTEANPTHVYSSVGTFNVTLSLIYDQNCVATYSAEVTTFETLVEARAAAAIGDCNNGSATIDFMDNSLNLTGEPLAYAWTFTGSDQTSSDVANPSVTVSESGTITASLTVTSADSCTSTFDTTLTVNLALVNLAEEIVICPGDSTELNPNPVAGQSYTWSPAPDFDANDPNPTTSIAGTYIVTVTTDAADLNCSNVDTVTVVVADSIGLVVNGPNGPVGSGNANGNGGMAGDDGDGDSSDGDAGGNEIVLPTVVSCGDPIDLNVDLMANEGVMITYTDLDGNVLGSGSTISLTPGGRDTVIVIAENMFGCIERDTIILINNQVDANIEAGANGLNFCSATDTIVRVVNLDPNDTLIYAWEPNDIITGPLDGESVDIISPEEGSVDLMVTVSNQFGCDTMITVTVSSTPFTPNVYPDTIRPCFQDDFTITGGDQIEGYDYIWEPNEGLNLADLANPIGNFTEDGTLMVTITDPTTGCSSTQTITVDVAPEIAFMVSPMDTAVCEPTMVTVGGSSENENVSITWYDDAELTNEIGTGGSFTIDAAEPGQTYTIYGRAVDSETECEQVVPATVTVSPITANEPLPNISACVGERPSIFGEVRPSQELTYEFEPASSVDLSDPTNPIFVGNDSQVITVTITDPATGCTLEREVNVNVTDLSGLSGSADPSEIILGGSSTLTVTGCDDCDYDWMPPNGTISPQGSATVTATPDMSGDLVYDVEVSQNGCSEIVMIELRVEDPICLPDNIYIPNAFTPNGDGRNDFIRVQSRFAEQLTEFRLIIYNRWGQEVYTSDDIFGQWDGTSEGDDLEPDVYGYHLRVVCPEGEELIQQGNISILR